MSHTLWLIIYESFVLERNRQLTLCTIITSPKPSQRSWRFIYQFNLFNTFKTNSKHFNSTKEFPRESILTSRLYMAMSPIEPDTQSVKIIKCADWTFCQVFVTELAYSLWRITRPAHTFDLINTYLQHAKIKMWILMHLSIIHRLWTLHE